MKCGKMLGWKIDFAQYLIYKHESRQSQFSKLALNVFTVYFSIKTYLSFFKLSMKFFCITLPLKPAGGLSITHKPKHSQPTCIYASLKCPLQNAILRSLCLALYFQIAWPIFEFSLKNNINSIKFVAQLAGGNI